MTYWPGDNADLYGGEKEEYKEVIKKRGNMKVRPESHLFIGIYNGA